MRHRRDATALYRTSKSGRIMPDAGVKREPRTIGLTVAYDGTAYRGWQVQPNGPTVQAAIERAVQRVTGEWVRLMAAGRTDAGVHALGQVASFRTRSRIPGERWRPALQHFLPEDIVIRHAREVAPEFHATHAAISKRYRYVIFNSPVPDPFVRHYAWRIPVKLDVAAMDAAARVLIGRHDFASFESSGSPREDSVRTVFDAAVFRCPGWLAWSPAPLAKSPAATGALQSALPRVGSAEPAQRQLPAADGSVPLFAPRSAGLADDAQGDPGHSRSAVGEYVCLEIEADGFLYNMVRAIAGSLARVGRGTWTPDEMARVLKARDRAAAAETAPAHGLYLVAVRYPEHLLSPGAATPRETFVTGD